MPSPSLSQSHLTARSCRARVALSVAAVLLACPAFAQDGRAPEKEKPKAAANKTSDKATADKASDIEASRFCANAAPSIAEARVAWETKQLSDLDARVKQRLVDLEKAEASVQEWVDKRDAALKSASDNLVAIYAKMQPETAATQIAAMDDQMAAAILGKLKAGAAGAILNEMEAERASKLATILSGATDVGKKS
jgi:flagellar motility protein MotE (MotC chaperone)